MPLISWRKPVRPHGPRRRREWGQRAERSNRDLAGLARNRGSVPSWHGCCGLNVATVWQTRSVPRCAKQSTCVVLCDYYHHPMECFCSLCSDEAPGYKIICPRLPRKKRGSRHLNLLTWQALLGVFCSHIPRYGWRDEAQEAAFLATRWSGLWGPAWVSHSLEFITGRCSQRPCVLRAVC